MATMKQIEIVTLETSSSSKPRAMHSVTCDIDSVISVTRRPPYAGDKDFVIELRMKGGSKLQSVFDPSFVMSFQKALDECMRLSSTMARSILFITGGSDRFFSLGLDLKWLNDHRPAIIATHNDSCSNSPTRVSHKKSKDKFHGSGKASDQQFNRNLSVLNDAICGLYKRLLTLEIPTVAVINGHCFGAAAFIAMCCDWRVIRTPKRAIDGFSTDASKQPLICFPEMKHGLNIGKGWRELLTAKLSHNAFRDSVLLARRWSPTDALKAGICDAVVGGLHCGDGFYADVCKLEIVSEAVECSWNRRNLKRIKCDMYHAVVQALSNHYTEPLTRLSKI